MAIMCNNVKHNRKRKIRATSIDFRGTKVYSKLKCGNQLIPISEGIIFMQLFENITIKVVSYL